MRAERNPFTAATDNVSSGGRSFPASTEGRKLEGAWDLYRRGRADEALAEFESMLQDGGGSPRILAFKSWHARAGSACAQ